MDERSSQLQHCMYQYSRAIYRSIKDLIDPYADRETQLESRRAVLEACEQTMERLASDPLYFAKPDRALFQDIRRYFPITPQAQVAWAVQEGVERRGRVRPGADRGRRVRRRRRPLPRDDAQGQAVPAHAAAGARLLPVAPAPRGEGRGVDRRRSVHSLFHRGDPQASPCKLRPRVSHDTDKLIRQLSLVAFLMAERRPLTARDVKWNVEGYSEMSDEAFARRFYSDRAELLALGVPLQSQRDEFTGEELYTLRSEQYFLPQLELDRRRAGGAPDGALPARGEVRVRGAAPARAPEPRARPARASPRRRPRRPCGSRCATPTTPPEMPGRLAKLEGAISKQRTVKFDYWSISRDKDVRAHAQPVRACSTTTASGTSSATTSTATTIRTFRVSRIRGDIRFATRRERDFRTPRRVRHRAATAAGRRGSSATPIGEARIEVRGDTAWWVERAYGSTGRLEDGVFVTEYSRLPMLASWVLRQDGRAVPLEPDELRREVAAACAASATATRARRRSRPASRPCEAAEAAGDRPAGPGHARALRGAPGAARLPARRLRRGEGRGRSRPPSSSSGSRSPPRSSRSTCRCSTSSTSAAAATRSTPSCTTTRCTSTRSSGATPSARRRG